jgi:hypothetical protein
LNTAEREAMTLPEIRDALRYSVEHDDANCVVFKIWADAIDAHLSRTAEPVAYALFTDKGLIRMWSREWFGDGHGKPVTPTPLFTHPSEDGRDKKCVDPLCGVPGWEAKDVLRDAARYRYVRENLPPGTFGDADVGDADSWDAAIDAAMAEDSRDGV